PYVEYIPEHRKRPYQSIQSQIPQHSHDQINRGTLTDHTDNQRTAHGITDDVTQSGNHADQRIQPKTDFRSGYSKPAIHQVGHIIQDSYFSRFFGGSTFRNDFVVVHNSSRRLKFSKQKANVPANGHPGVCSYSILLKFTKYIENSPSSVGPNLLMERGSMEWFLLH